MDADEALGIVEKALSRERLSKLQMLVFRQTWDELSYQEIAKSTGYEVGYIKQTGSQLWQSLSKAFGEKVSKSNIQSVLKRYAIEQGLGISAEANLLAVYMQPKETLIANPGPTALPLSTVTARYQDWGEATDVSVFYGRTSELETLEKWVLQDQCRLIGLFGMGGIGKTALSVRLAKQIQGQFEYVIWRSLRNAPPIHDLLTDLSQFLANRQGGDPPLVTRAESLDKQILRLLSDLRAHRCLLILDNAETVMQAGDRNGGYQPGYEGYGQLLRCVGEAQHQSCLLLTSREKPKGFAPKEGETLPVRSLQLTGLAPSIGRALFNLKGTFAGSTAEWQTVIEHYAGNPLALKIVATAIVDFFDGSLTRFLEFSQQGNSVFGDIRDLLARQVGRLSDLEQQVMFWLAINREPISFAELQSDCLPPVSPSQLLETLTSLERRSLIESSDRRFTLQPVVMEYMTELLINGVCQEMAGTDQLTANALSPLALPLLRAHALIKAQAQDYIRETQIRLILAPIAHWLLHTYSRTDLDRRLMQLLSVLRGRSHQEIGYIGGNIINLLCQLQLDASDGIRPADGSAKYTLHDRDFSQLTIWQAYLRNVNLHNTNFSHSDLSRSVFTETFSQILSVAFSPDGQLLAASDISYEVHLWRIADGKKLLTCKARDGWAWAVAFTPDSRFLASSANGTIHFWDVQTGDCVQTIHGFSSRIFGLAFSPDGAYLASGNEDHQVRIWCVATGELVAVLAGHTDEVHAVAFSADGCVLASGSYDRTVKLWNLSVLECPATALAQAESPVVTLPAQQTLTAHTHWVWSVAFGPDGKTLASSSSDRTIKFWELTTGQCTRTLTGHAQPVRSIAFVPPSPGDRGDEACLVSGSDDRTIRLWNRQGDCLRVLHGHTSWVSAVAVSPNGSLLASGSEDQSVRLWNSHSSQCLRLLQGYNSGVWSIAFSPDGRTLVSGGQDRIVRLWSVAAIDRQDPLTANGLVHTVPQTLKGHTSWIWSVAVSPDGQTVASSSEDGTVQLWDMALLQSAASAAQSPSQILRGHTHAVWSVAFSADGQTLASGSLDGTIRLWHRSQTQWQPILKEHQSGVWSVAFAPSGRWGDRQCQLLASGSQDQTIRLWEIPAPTASQPELAIRPLRTLLGHVSWIRCVAFSPDGQWLASGSSDGIVILWHVETGVQRLAFQAHSSLVLTVAFSPDGQMLASSGGDGIIKLWAVGESMATMATATVDLRAGAALTALAPPLQTSLHGHQNWVRFLTYSPDGECLASCSQDGTIKLWQWRSTTCVETLRVHRPYEGTIITGVTGLSIAQKNTLTLLGAIDGPIGTAALNTHG